MYYFLSFHLHCFTYLSFGKHACIENETKGAKLHELLLVQQQGAD
jgi:hypothetical protein